MSFERAPDANLDAKFLAKKPTKLGGQRRRRGGLVLTFCTTHNKPDLKTRAESWSTQRGDRAWLHWP